MTRFKVIAILTLVLTPAGAVPAGMPLDMNRLDQALTVVQRFEYGANSNPLEFIEQTVMAAATRPGERAQVEQRLLATLANTRTRDGKIFLCRQLRTIGTEQCIGRLEPLLADPEVSHAARYALGSIEGDAASAALHRTLNRVPPALQVGMANTLGERRYTPATNDLVRLLGSSEPAVAGAAAKALGRIGNPIAVAALQKARPGAARAVQSEIDRALILCAEGFVAEGKPAAAQRIYQEFYAAGQPRHIRLAALRGLVLTQGPQGAATLVEALQGGDTEVRQGAIGLMPLVEGRAATRRFADMLDSLPPETQEMMIRALGDRGHSEAESAIIKAGAGPNEQVRVAAAEALGKVGGLASVVPLAKMAAGSGPEKPVARQSLARLNPPGINVKLLAAMDEEDPAVQAEIIRVLGERGLPAATVKLRKAAEDDREGVRREAIRAIGKMGGPGQLRTLLDIAIAPKDPGDREVVEQAVVDLFSRMSDPEAQVQPVLNALTRAPNEAKPVLLRLLGRPATPAALAAVRRAMKDPDPGVSDAAVRTLADWPNIAAADDLLVIAGQSGNQAHKVLALRGYVRLAGLSNNPTSMYVRAMNAAERAEDKKLVLAGLATADSVEALDIVQGYIDNPQLKAEAALATVQIAERLKGSHPDRAKAAMRKVVSSVESSATRDKAQAIINEIEQYEGYILTWLGAGPYSERGKEGPQLFDTAFDPEKAEAVVTWRPVRQGLGSWNINLAATFGGRDNVAAYLRTTVISPVEQEVQIEVGSDDSIKVWLNGQFLHGTNASRSISPRQDVVRARLNAAVNTLMLKVINNGGGWEAACRIRKPDGTAIDGLRFEAADTTPRPRDRRRP